MATAQGLAIVEAARQAQAQVAAQTTADYLKLFPLLVADGQVDRNTPRWLDYVMQVLTVRRRQSAALTAQYMTAYRIAELGSISDGFSVKPALELPVDAVRTSLMVTGPVELRKEIQRGGTLQGSQHKVAANSARAAVRHVENGSRDTRDNITTTDKRVVGYVRVTSLTPCYFCAMLASRGPVYESDSFHDSDPRFHGPGNQKVHDGCGCILLPLYSKENPAFLQRTREFENLWKQTGSVLKFRQAYEGRA